MLEVYAIGDDLGGGGGGNGMRGVCQSPIEVFDFILNVLLLNSTY